MIDQAINVLDGEKAYNDNNLDMYLMGINKLSIKKKPVKSKPTISPPKVKSRKLSVKDETFYQKYLEK